MRSFFSMSAWMSIGCVIPAAARESQFPVLYRYNGEVRDAPEPMKSAHSSVSSRPMRISRWRLDWGRMGMCGFWKCSGADRRMFSMTGKQMGNDKGKRRDRGEHGPD